MILENIALIASVISSIAAVTTSLRALGVSREHARFELESKIRSGCRVSGLKASPPTSQRSSLGLHLLVTVIWYVLSVIFALPLLMQECINKNCSARFLRILPFILVATVLVLIWRRIASKRN